MSELPVTRPPHREPSKSIAPTPIHPPLVSMTRIRGVAVDPPGLSLALIGNALRTGLGVSLCFAARRFRSKRLEGSRWDGGRGVHAKLEPVRQALHSAIRAEPVASTAWSGYSIPTGSVARASPSEGRVPRSAVEPMRLRRMRPPSLDGMGSRFTMHRIRL